jgi:hypothetical protein
MTLRNRVSIFNNEVRYQIYYINEKNYEILTVPQKEKIAPNSQLTGLSILVKKIIFDLWGLPIIRIVIIV